MKKAKRMTLFNIMINVSRNVMKDVIVLQKIGIYRAGAQDAYSCEEGQNV